MLIRKPDRILGSEITPETVYYNRRQFMAASSAGLASLALPTIAKAGLQEDDEITPEDIVPNTTTFMSSEQTRAIQPPLPMKCRRTRGV